MIEGNIPIYFLASEYSGQEGKKMEKYGERKSERKSLIRTPPEPICSFSWETNQNRIERKNQQVLKAPSLRMSPV